MASDPTNDLQSFVIIFRQHGSLSPEDLRRRAEETGAWARLQNDAGHRLDPRILGPEVEERRSARAAGPAHDAARVTALLFLVARDLRDAARVAEAHPGRRYGADVEVRPWAPPAGAQLR